MFKCGKPATGGKRFNWLAASIVVVVSMAIMACGESRFSMGDEVGVPPLPPSDKIIGLFDKTPSADLTGNIYKVKDFPKNGAEQPVGLAFDGFYRLFFMTGLAGDDLQVNPMGSGPLAANALVIGPGANSTLESAVGGDDAISAAIVPGANAALDALCPVADDIVSADGNHCLPGANGKIDTGIAGDDRISTVILSGVNGISESPHVLKMGTVRPASFYISTGPNGVMESGLADGDVQIASLGTGSLSATLDVVVSGGTDGKLNTAVVGDDAAVWAVLPGLNGIRESAAGGGTDDVVSSDGNFVLPGPDGSLHFATIGAMAGDDVVGKVILPGIDGIADSGRGDGETQGLFELNGTEPSRVGIPVAQGEPNRKAIKPRSGSKVTTPCVFDDNTYMNKDFKIIKVKLYDGIYSGIDGIVQSGLGGDDVQVAYANALITPGSLVTRGGADGINDTHPGGGDDIVVLTTGTMGATFNDTVVTTGQNANLETCPQGDDETIEPKILAGPNSTSNTVAVGDDIQVIPAGWGKSSDGTSIGGFSPVVLAGPNGTLESIPAGDDEYFELTFGNDLLSRAIVVGANKRADSYVADDLAVVIEGGDGTVQAGIGGDDIQIFSAGIKNPPIPLPEVIAGVDGTFQTQMLGDDMEAVYDFSWTYPISCAPGGPCAGSDVQSVAGPNDIQVVPVGAPSAFDVGPVDGMPDLIFPAVIAGGLSKKIDPATVIAADESLTIFDPGAYEAFATLQGAAVMIYTAGGTQIDTFANPDGNGVLESGLGGRGAFDYLAGCATALDNGGTPGVNDPLIGVPAYSIPMPRTGCGDDYQPIAAGTAATADDVIIHSGVDKRLYTLAAGDDSEAIIDGGNGVAESGIARNDLQVIDVGNGASRTVGLIAARNPLTGLQRTLVTNLSGDDALADPSRDNDLTGNKDFRPDNSNTKSDADGNTIVENMANVDDGEYFSWESTEINTINIPSFSPNVPFDTGVVRSLLTYDVINEGNGLVAYVSDGMSIYRSTSVDGLAWTTDPTPVLTPGGAATGVKDAPVVLAGVDGICDTTAAAGDLQAIPLGEGRPNTIAIWSGRELTLESVVMGDDVKEGHFIRTGPDGIRDSVVAGNDWEVIPIGQGQADAACIIAGSDGDRDTLDANIMNDDRPPFIDINGNASTVPLPDGIENLVDIGEGDYAGFDSFAVSHPSVFKFEGKYYMFYTGWGAAVEKDPARPDQKAEDILGPCMRPGMDRMADMGDVNAAMNDDNDSQVLVGPRIGLAVSNNGVNWNKMPDPIVRAGNVCSSLFDLSILKALGIDPMDLGIDPYMAASMDFDYLGTFGAQVRNDPAADDGPVFSMAYNGVHFSRPYDPAAGIIGALQAMGADSSTGREQFAGLKTGVGLARSFALKDGWKKMKETNPIFSGGVFYAPIGERYPTILEIKNGYVAFFEQHDSANDTLNNDDQTYIGISRRYGTVYSLCAAAKNVSGGDIGKAAVWLVLIMLPAAILVFRKTLRKWRN